MPIRVHGPPCRLRLRRVTAAVLATPPGPPARRGPWDDAVYFTRFFLDPLGFVGERFEQYGDIYYAPSGGVGLYVLRDPEHIWEVLVRDAAKYGKTHSALRQLEGVLGEGLLTTDGDLWRRQRRLVQPAFGPKRLAEYAAAFVDECERTARGWYPGQVRDLSREMMDLTLRVVCRTLFGHDVSGQTDVVWGAIKTLTTGFAAARLVPGWVPGGPQARSEQARADLDEVVMGMIADRRASGQSHPDLLQRLLDARDEDGSALTDVEIRDQLLTLFIAGHETTSHALTWTLYLLSQHPEVEAELRRELRETLGGRPPRYDDLPNLTYTRMVFDEAMRLFPPAYTVARRAEADTVIGNWEVPKGAEVIVWIYRAHRLERVWPEPERFDPERFRPEASAARPKCAYLPFGAGPRACIGKVFAQVEGQLLLASLLQQFHFELEAGHPVEPLPRITLSPKHGMRMVLTEV